MAEYPTGRRELSADFGGIKTANLSLLKRPDALTFDYLTAFSLGPVNLGDSSRGPVDRPWYVRADNPSKTIYTARANDSNTGWEAETILFVWEGEDLNEIDFAFEQSGRPVVCAERTVAGVKEVWLYWFKPLFGNFIFEKFDDGRTPRIVLDNPPDTANSDLEFFYLKPGDGLVVRVQREIYDTAHITPHIDEVDWYLEDVFYTNNWRIAAVLVKHNPGGQYIKKRLETALMPFRLYDTDSIHGSVGFPSGDVLRRVLIVFSSEGIYEGAYPQLQDPDYLSGLSGILPGDLHETLVVLALYDMDTLKGSPTVLATSTLVVVGPNMMYHTLYDIDTLKGNPTVLDTSVLRVVLITNTLYDIETLKGSPTIQDTSTLV